MREHPPSSVWMVQAGAWELVFLVLADRRLLVLESTTPGVHPGQVVDDQGEGIFRTAERVA